MNKRTNLDELDDDTKEAIANLLNDGEAAIPTPLLGYAKMLLLEGYAEEKPVSWDKSVMVPTQKLKDECRTWQVSHGARDFSNLGGYVAPDCL